jgi:hypothetical protein
LGFLFYMLLIKNRIARGFMADNETTTQDQASSGGGQDQASNTQQSQADTTSNQNNTNPNLTVDELKKIVEDLRKEQASNRNKLKAQETAQAKAEEERLKKQGEFQTLAEQRETRVKELEPQVTALTTERDELAGILTAQLEAEIKDWPAEIKAMDPGKEAGLKARSAWRDKAKIAVEKFVGTGAPARPGNRPNPPASGGNGKDVVAELRSTGNYQRF